MQILLPRSDGAQEPALAKMRLALSLRSERFNSGGEEDRYRLLRRSASKGFGDVITPELQA